MIINYELEKEVLGALIKKPSLIRNVYVEAEWFTNPTYQEIFVGLEILDGTKESTFDIFSHITTMNKTTQVTFAMIMEIKNSVVSVSSLTHNALSLQKQYLDVKLIETSHKASTGLTDEVKAELKYVLTEIERVSAKTDEGELGETFDLIEKNLYEDGEESIKTFYNLDFLLGGGLYGGMLFTIGARPGVGKTAFSAVGLVNKAIERNKDLKVDLFTMEMSKKEMVGRYVSMETGISSDKLKMANKVLTNKEKENVKKALNKFRQDDYNLKVHDTASDLQEIIARIKASVFEHGDKPYLCVIDYVGLIKVKSKYKDRRLEIETITRELKVLANELNIPIILLSQLSRGIENRQDKTPVLSDLRESASLEQDSNLVGFLTKHTPEEVRDKGLKHNLELIIQKNREGSTGTLYYNFIENEMRFEVILY